MTPWCPDQLGIRGRSTLTITSHLALAVSLNLTSPEEAGSVYPNLPTTLPSTCSGKYGVKYVHTGIDVTRNMGVLIGSLFQTYTYQTLTHFPLLTTAQMIKDNLHLKTPSMHVTPNSILQIIIHTFHLISHHNLIP